MAAKDRVRPPLHTGRASSQLLSQKPTALRRPYSPPEPRWPTLARFLRRSGRPKQLLLRVACQQQLVFLDAYSPVFLQRRTHVSRVTRPIYVFVNG